MDALLIGFAVFILLASALGTALIGVDLIARRRVMQRGDYESPD